MKKYKKTWFLIIALFILALISIATFYYKQQNYADWVQAEYGIDDGQYNAIKHSSAASDIYISLTTIGLSNNFAVSIIEQLGKLNERVEQIVRNKDSTLEMQKDMYNNAVGFHAAHWFSQKSCPIKLTSAAQLLILLTQHNILANRREDLRWQTQHIHISTRSKNLTQAISWYDNKRKDIKDLVFSFLDQRFCKKRRPIL